LSVSFSIATSLDFFTHEVDSLPGFDFVFLNLAGFVGRLWISSLVPWSVPSDLVIPDFIFASRLGPPLSPNRSRPARQIEVPAQFS
jgi:hypothetical protein